MSHTHAGTDAPECTTCTCREQYGKNPDRCNRPVNHKGPHSNKWGTTWATSEQWDTGRWNA
jgi:hypothetical protein